MTAKNVEIAHVILVLEVALSALVDLVVDLVLAEEVSLVTGCRYCAGYKGCIYCTGSNGWKVETDENLFSNTDCTGCIVTVCTIILVLEIVLVVLSDLVAKLVSTSCRDLTGSRGFIYCTGCKGCIYCTGSTGWKIDNSCKHWIGIRGCIGQYWQQMLHCLWY